MASAVSSAEIVQARADLETMLPDQCSVQRAVDASDGGGGQTTTWSEVVTDVPCRITAATTGRGNNGSSRAGERLNDSTTHVITFSAGRDVQQNDHIIINGTAYAVLLVGDGGAWELARHVEVHPVT